jgi:hypothetical protein
MRLHYHLHPFHETVLRRIEHPAAFFCHRSGTAGGREKVATEPRAG